MKKLLIAIMLFFTITVSAQDLFDTTGVGSITFEAPADYTQYNQLHLYRLLSHPGGWLNWQFWMIDSLFNELEVLLDTTQLFIRNDTLFISDSFLSSALDTLTIDTLAYLVLNPNLAAPTYAEGKVAFDSLSHSLVYFTEEPDVVMNMGREAWIRIYNNSGVTIPNGSYVYPTGAVAGGWGTVALALADADSTSNVIGQATHSIEDGTFGYLTRFGDVKDMNCIGFQLGGTGYLSADTAGRPTTTKPDAPNNAIALGGVTWVGTTDSTGAMFALMDRFNPVNGRATVTFADSSVLIDATSNTQVTNPTGNLFTYVTTVGHDITLSGDTLYFAETGVYNIAVSVSFGGGANGEYYFSFKDNGTTIPGFAMSRITSNADVGAGPVFLSHIFDAGDNMTFWVEDVGSSANVTMKHCTIMIEQVR